MMFGAGLTEQAARLIDLCRKKQLLIATAESCTGGLIAGLLTSIAGSSDVFDAGFVTYSNEAKSRMIGVPPELIARVGAVSAEVALAMAQGALDHSRADIAIAVTGVAGPGGGSVEKPVGLVYCAALSRTGAALHVALRLGGIGRDGIRLATVAQAVEMLRQLTAAAP